MQDNNQIDDYMVLSHDHICPEGKVYIPGEGYLEDRLDTPQVPAEQPLEQRLPRLLIATNSSPFKALVDKNPSYNDILVIADAFTRHGYDVTVVSSRQEAGAAYHDASSSYPPASVLILLPTKAGETQEAWSLLRVGKDLKEASRQAGSGQLSVTVLGSEQANASYRGLLEYALGKGMIDRVCKREEYSFQANSTIAA